MQQHHFKKLQYTSFKGDKGGARLLILAGVHGDEYEPIAAATKLLKMVPELLSAGTVTIVPIVNFPAFSRASRTADDGLDLARICPGNKNGSVSEVIAAEVSELISVSDYLIDMHTGGAAYEIDPLCGYVLHEDADVLDKQREMARAFNLKTIWGTSNKLNGRTLSVARDHNVPAVYTEFGGGGGCKEAIVGEYVQGCVNVMNMFGMCVGTRVNGRYEYEVEDYREESGHLQIMLPASMDGFFQPEVRLGDFVKKEQLIGTIADRFGQARVPVHADQDGMIFLLRAIPSVKKGDTLGGVLPITKPGKVTIYE
jgi:predicted deacylase